MDNVSGEDVRSVLRIAMAQTKNARRIIGGAVTDVYERQARDLIQRGRAHPLYKGDEDLFEQAGTYLAILALEASISRKRS